jgi:hypothetical protein
LRENQSHGSEVQINRRARYPVTFVWGGGGGENTKNFGKKKETKNHNYLNTQFITGKFFFVIKDAGI